jgi:hypothetical protein
LANEGIVEARQDWQNYIGPTTSSSIADSCMLSPIPRQNESTDRNPWQTMETSHRWHSRSQDQSVYR